VQNKNTASSVSVIIPTFNRAGFIMETVESVLKQEYEPKEIIVVDDGSSDNTRNALQVYGSKVKYIYQENAGPPAARNRGITAASGEIIAFLDSDDLWPEHKLRDQMKHFNSDLEIDIVLGALQYFTYKLDNKRKKNLRFLSEPILAYNLGAAIFRMSAFHKVGMFDEQLHHSDDWDWFVRAMDTGLRFKKIPEVTLYNRRHSGNLSNQRQIGNRHTLHMLKKTLDRRRDAFDERRKTDA
jgi:glycosyltransferase involved in cell wall biosynthesis